MLVETVVKGLPCLDYLFDFKKEEAFRLVQSATMQPSLPPSPLFIGHAPILFLFP